MKESNLVAMMHKRPSETMEVLTYAGMQFDVVIDERVPPGKVYIVNGDDFHEIGGLPAIG